MFVSMGDSVRNGSFGVFSLDVSWYTQACETAAGCRMLSILSSKNCISLLSSYITSKYLYTPYITGGVEAISATVS